MIYFYLSVAYFLALAKSVFVPDTVSTYAGSEPGHADGFGSQVQFQSPYGVSISPNLRFAFIVENYGILRFVDRLNGRVSTVAGGGSDGFSTGSSNGYGTNVMFSNPLGVAISPDNTYALIADSGNNRIRHYNVATGEVSDFVGQNAGIDDGSGTSAQFNSPNGIAIDLTGNFALIADTANHLIRKLFLKSKNVVAIAGGRSLLGSDNGVGSDARFNLPTDIAIDPMGKYALITDGSNFQIRKLVLSTNMVSTYAGSIEGIKSGFGADVQFKYPFSIAIARDGKYALVTDTYANNIRKINLENGYVGIYAGQEDGSLGHDDDVGTNSKFANPYGIDISPSGRSALVADAGNYQLRKIQILHPPTRPGLR